MARTICKIVGIAFIGVAVWGFAAGDKVLMFQVNTAQNILHLLTGIAAFHFGYRTEHSARTCAAALAAIYGIVGVLGILGAAPVVSRLNLNTPDNLLHIVCGAVFFAAAFAEQIGISRYFGRTESQLPPGGQLQH